MRGRCSHRSISCSRQRGLCVSPLSKDSKGFSFLRSRTKRRGEMFFSLQLAAIKALVFLQWVGNAFRTLPHTDYSGKTRRHPLHHDRAVFGSEWTGPYDHVQSRVFKASGQIVPSTNSGNVFSFRYIENLRKTRGMKCT